MSSSENEEEDMEYKLRGIEEDKRIKRVIREYIRST